jgi:hypothetical protein
MNEYCQPLNLSIFPLNNIAKTINAIKKTGHLSLDVNIDINPTLVESLKSYNISIGFAEVFYRKPNCKPLIHSDAGLGDYVKINWVIGGKDSVMQWFTVKPDIHKQVIYNPIGTTLYVYDLSEVNFTVEEHISSPSLVQVGLPHNIINLIEERICISLVINCANNHNRLTMNEAKKRLAVFIN